MSIVLAEATLPDVLASAWADRVRVHLVRTVENILAAGQELDEAKAALGHGRFEAMVTDELGMAPRTAQMFMALVRNPALVDANHGSHLPPSWRSLYELSRLPEADLTAAIEAHEVRPDMERREALQLVRRYLDADAPPAAARPPARRLPLPDQVRSAGWELDKVVTRLEKLVADDRFNQHEEVVGGWLRFHLDRAVALRDRLEGSA